MCDKGIIETWPGVAKLQYCIVISPELQKDIVNGINKLLGEDIAVLDCPLPDKYPEENYDTNEVVVADKRSKTYIHKKYLPGSIEPICVTQHYDNICYFSLTQMHGCCGILVSHNMVVLPKYRNKGIANFLQEIKERIAKENDYSKMICTVLSNNVEEKHILISHGWKLIDEFTNKRTGNTVETWSKEIK